MLDALYTAASGMLAQQIGLDVIANNLANVNTVGYKGQRAAFEDLLYNNIGPRQGGRAGPADGPRRRVISGIQAQFDEGSAQNTGVPTDFMITGGAGFFVVRKPDGTQAYTRAGNFGIDGAGQLVTPAGRPGARPGRPPDHLPAEHEVVRDGRQGQRHGRRPDRPRPRRAARHDAVRQPGGPDPERPEPVPASADSGTPSRVASTGAGGTIIQGFLEMANVKAVDEMVNMITDAARLRVGLEGRAGLGRDARHRQRAAPLMTGIAAISGTTAYSPVGPMPAGVKAPTTAEQQRAVRLVQAVRGRLRPPDRVAAG